MSSILLGLVVLLVLVLLAMVAMNAKFRRDCRAGAEKIHREMVGVFSREHDHRMLAPADQPAIPREGYERIASELAARGFRVLGAFEDITVSTVYPANRTYMESHVSEDGATTATTYFVPQIGKQVVDVATAFEDGRMVAVTSAEMDTLRPPPWMLRETTPLDTELSVLVARHQTRLAEFREKWPDVAPRAVRSLEDVVRWSADYSRRTGEFRRSMGWLTEAEMMSFARNPGERFTAEHIWKEFQALVARERMR
jgi:hypothetical protein